MAHSKAKNTLIATFLELAAIDEVHPYEKEVLTYVKHRLERIGVVYHQDETGNIVARIPGKNPDALGFAVHVDIAAPLHGRKVMVTDKVVKTDGTGILGADDKIGVAALLELADLIQRTTRIPSRTLEFLFTVGEERGMTGAKGLDCSLLSATQLIIIDMCGPVTTVIAKSPANFRMDVRYMGKAVASALWQDGKNAGAALIAACAGLQQGEFEPGVIFNIGRLAAGDARNQVAGEAWLEAEMRSFDTQRLETVASKIEAHFLAQASNDGVTAQVTIDRATVAYTLNQKGTLFDLVQQGLQSLQLAPQLIEVFGCFDGNILTGYGREVVVMGGGYYNPHSHDEYLDIAEANQMWAFVQHAALSS